VQPEWGGRPVGGARDGAAADAHGGARGPLRTLKLTLAYEGTRYVGWQRQAAGTSIQGVLEEALGRIEGAPVRVRGSGRTDAGVHATAQVASVRLSHPIAPAALRRALNAVLPADIRVGCVEHAPASFDARFNAIGKTYRYRILNEPVADPFERLYAWHVAVPLDPHAMRAALAPLVGRHDFAAFQASGSGLATTVRTVFDAGVEWAQTGEPDGIGDRARDDPVTVGMRRDAPIPRGGRGLLAVVLTADGFLRHMVRNIVGTLVEVGAGRRQAGDMAALIASRDRRQAGPTAPPHGLFLVRVDYPGLADVS
jgi:tRNA pseudouridine38-40 synthase